MTQLTIKVTKEILEQAKHCSLDFLAPVAGENCAIALAVRTIFPLAFVSENNIFMSSNSAYDGSDIKIHLPQVARRFIKKFDKATPSQRIQMPEIAFTVDVPDEIIDSINIDEIRPLLVNHPTLTLIEA